MHQQPEKDREEGSFNMSIPKYKLRNYFLDLFWGESLELTQNHVTTPQGPAFPAENTHPFLGHVCCPCPLGLGYIFWQGDQTDPPRASFLTYVAVFSFHSPKWLYFEEGYSVTKWAPNPALIRINPPAS